MTHFEYLAIAFSLVISFSAMRMLAGLPHVLAPANVYWIHGCFVISHLLVTAVSFWNMWNFRVADWSLPRFLLVLAIPGSLYYCACALVPERPDEVESWRDHYFELRRRYFGGVFFLICSISITLYAVVGVPILTIERVPQVVAGTIAAAGFASANERLHATLALTMLASLLLSSIAIFASPDFLIETTTQ